MGLDWRGEGVVELGLGLDLGFCLAGTEAGEVVAFVKKEVIWRCGLINGDAPLLRRRDDDIALYIRQTVEPGNCGWRERERTINYLSIKRNEGKEGWNKEECFIWREIKPGKSYGRCCLAGIPPYSPHSLHPFLCNLGFVGPSLQ